MPEPLKKLWSLNDGPENMKPVRQQYGDGAFYILDSSAACHER